MSNWSKVMLVILTLIVLFFIPITRSIILFILPLGSGVDDLLFFVLLFVAAILLLMKILPDPDWLRKFALWFTK